MTFKKSFDFELNVQLLSHGQSDVMSKGSHAGRYPSSKIAFVRTGVLGKLHVGQQLSRLLDTLLQLFCLTYSHIVPSGTDSQTYFGAQPLHCLLFLLYMIPKS